VSDVLEESDASNEPEKTVIDTPDTTGTGKIGYKRPPKSQKLLSKAARVVELTVAGLNQAEIAQSMGIERSNVRDILLKFRPVFSRLDDAPNYKMVRAQILEAAELRLLESVLCESAIAKAPLNQRAYALDIVHKIRRLETGQSTTNISTRTAIELPPSTTLAVTP
jgi:hypothetical protein